MARCSAGGEADATCGRKRAEMRIALDAMGGDHAPRETVKGAVAAAREHGVEVVLVGRNGAIEAELKACRWELPIIHANDVVGADE